MGGGRLEFGKEGVKWGERGRGDEQIRVGGAKMDTASTTNILIPFLDLIL